MDNIPLGAVHMVGVCIDIYGIGDEFEIIACVTSAIYDVDGNVTDDVDFADNEKHIRPTLPDAIECAVSMSTRYSIDGKPGRYEDYT